VHTSVECRGGLCSSLPPLLLHHLNVLHKDGLAIRAIGEPITKGASCKVQVKMMSREPSGNRSLSSQDIVAWMLSFLCSESRIMRTTLAYGCAAGNSPQKYAAGADAESGHRREAVAPAFSGQMRGVERMVSTGAVLPSRSPGVCR